MNKSNFLVFDCETGGLDYTKQPITQYACVVLDFKTLKEIERWETFVKPYNNLTIMPEALQRTLVTMSDINLKGITYDVFVKTLSSFLKQNNTIPSRPALGKLVPVGHNILAFDNRFMEYVFDLCNLNYYDFVSENAIDTYSMAKAAFAIEGNEKLNLTECCNNIGLDFNNAHHAMNDVEANAELFRWFVKKLRSKVGVSKDNSYKGRKIGNDFFEFKCAQTNISK